MKDTKRDRQALSWLNRTVPEIRPCVFWLTLVQMANGIIGVSYAMSLRSIIDCAVDGDRAGLIRSTLMLACLVAMQFLMQILGRYLDEYTRSTAENRLKSALLGNLLRRDYAQVTATHSGEWMNRLTSDAVVIANASAHIVPGALGMIARMIAAAWVLLALIPRFTIVLLAGGTCLTISTLWMRRILKRLHRQIRESDGRLRICLTERLGSLMILKAYQQEDAAQAQAEQLMQAHKAARMKKNRFSNFCNSGFSLAMNGTFAAGAVYCGFGILNGTLGYGTFTAVIHLVTQLQSPVAGLTSFIPQYYAMLASTERLMEAEELSDGDCTEQDADLSAFRGIGLRDLSFAYPDSGDGRRGAIQHLSLAIRQGEYTAFSGPSGCGKSTVLKLLLCLYTPDAGARYVLTDRGEEPLTAAWSRLFAYVPQGNHLMSGRVRDVVAFAHPERAGEDSALLEALEIACARDFIEQLPEGLDTVLGERGSGLSEGQMQRLAIARALFSDRPVLLLDEATSALDGPSEVRLLQNIRALTGKTVIIVTHRPAALEVVEKVIRFSEQPVREAP